MHHRSGVRCPTFSLSLVAPNIVPYRRLPSYYVFGLSTQRTHPDHGAQYLDQQFAVKRHGCRTRLVRASRRLLLGKSRVALGCNFTLRLILKFVPRAKPLPELQRRDLILAADCVYFEPAFPLLVSTLAALVPPPPEHAPEVLFCYKKRRKADKRFFALLKKYFTWSIVRDQEPTTF